MARRHNKARNPREGYVYRAPVRHHKPKRGGPPVWVLVLVCVAALAALAVLLGILLREKPEQPDTDLPISVSVVVPSYSVSLPHTGEAEGPPPDSAPEPEPEEPVVLTFTAEEIERLDTMLTEWAAAVTAPVGEQDESDAVEQVGGEGQEGPVSSPDSSTTLTPETYGHNVSVYFMDLDSGLSYLYNEGKSYLIASLNKAPYAMYLYTLAEQGELELGETVYVTTEMLEKSAENSGRLKDDESLPRNLTIEELIYEMLRYSDTGALRILLERYPAEGYVAFAETLDLPHPENVRSVTNGRITPEDAGAYLVALHNYMQQGAYGERLYEHLTNTRNLMIRSQYPVARKYGWDVESLHDMAVVYADHPYALAILTDKSYGTWGEQAMFATIAATFEEIMAEKWAAVELARQ